MQAVKLLNNHLDGILAHRCVASEISHRLGYVGSIETDVPAWKKARTGVTAETDEEWARYNSVDLAVTAQVIDNFIPRVKARQQLEALRVHHKVQEMCVGLHKIGFYVDQAVRAELEEQYRNKAIVALKRIRTAAGDPDLNPNSVPKLRDLLFEKWDIPVGKGHRTKSGDPSTDDDSIRDIASRLKAKKIRLKNQSQVIELIDALRKFRRASKYLGTYIRKAVPFTQQIPYDDFSDDEDDVWLELDGDVVEYDRLDEDEKSRIKKKRSGGKKYGILFPDGRIHADFSAHGPSTGRISSSNPNCFDAQTEILTAGGWVRFDQLREGVPVAQWHADGRVDFVIPTAYVRQRAQAMVALRNEHIDLRVTPDHRCLLRHCKTRELRVFAASVYPSAWQQLHAGIFAGGSGLDLTDAELRLLVATQADGSWTDSSSGIDFAFVRARKIDRMRQLLAQAGASYYERARTTKTCFEVGGKEYTSKMTRFNVHVGPTTDKIKMLLGKKKVFGSWLLHMSRRQIDIFLEEVQLWDGSFTRRNSYSSSIKQNTDWVQALQVLSGIRANVREYKARSGRSNWQTDQTNRDYSLTTNIARRFEACDETVYCVSVPSSYVVVRRNGRVMVTGQCQNFPKALRRMLRADPLLRHVLIYADMDQLELRFAAAIWNLRAYIKAFNTPGVDPHDLSATLIFGDLYAKMAKGDAKSRLRDFAKRFAYAVIYGALIETIHEVITSSEGTVKCPCGGVKTCQNCSGSGMTDGLPFAEAKIEQTEQAYKDWTGNVSEIHVGWEGELETYQKQGFLCEPILGFRRDFMDAGGDKDIRNEILNFRCQAGGAAIVHLGTVDFMKCFPFDFGAKTGLVNQAHDALTAEVACTCDLEEIGVKKGDEIKKVSVHQEKCEVHEVGLALEQSLTREVRDCTKKGKKLPVKFTAKATVKSVDGKIRVKQMTHWS